MKSMRPQSGGWKALQVAALAAVCLLPLTGSAQDYPSRPITIVVGFPAGSATDNLVRPLANALQGSLMTPSLRRPSPRLGEHTDEVLAESGMTTAEISSLRASAIVE